MLKLNKRMHAYYDTIKEPYRFFIAMGVIIAFVIGPAHFELVDVSIAGAIVLGGSRLLYLSKV